MNGWQYSGRKIDPILQTVVHLVHVQWSFFATSMHLNNVCETNKRKTLWRKDTRMPMCVRVRACAHRCVRVRVCVGEGLLFAFLFAWVRACGCVRVCVCACGWGGVQCRRCFWARARRLASTYTPGTQRDKLFTFTTTPRLFTTPLYHEPKGISCLPRTQGCLPSPKGCLPLPRLAGYLSIGYLVVG